MHLTRLAVKRPVMTGMVFILFTFLGLVSAPLLGVDFFPPVDIPYIAVYTRYSGAGPEEIETQVIKPIEEAVSSLNNIKNITSTASEGIARIAIEFNMGADLDIAAIDVQKSVDSVRGKLPMDAEAPTVHKFNFNADPVAVLALTGDIPLEDIYRLADDQVKDRLQHLPGVAQVEIAGGREREIQVAVDSHKLDAYGLGVGSVISLLAAENMNVPAGRLERENSEFSLRVLGEYGDIAEIRDLHLGLPGGGRIMLKEIADVNFGVKDFRTFCRLDGKEAVSITVRKTGDANMVAVAGAVKKELNRLNEVLPPGVRMSLVRDGSAFIQKTLNDTWKNLIEGIITTGLVLLLFLREWRATFIVTLAIPAALVATMTLMYFSGFSFNLLTILGLVTCIGILVDDSIVVLENIHRHRVQLGKDPAAAAVDGRTEIGTAAVAITMSDVAVFGPIAFMTGMVGQFFKQFGLTVIFAALLSLFISFTLTPMLSSRMTLKKAAAYDPPAGRWASAQQKAYVYYESVLRWAFDHRPHVVVTCFLLPMLAFSFIPLNILKTEFLPRYDQDQVTISLEMPPGTSLAATGEALSGLEKKALAMPEVESVFATVGRSGEQYMGYVNAQNGSVLVKLKPKHMRDLAQWDIAAAMRNWGDYIPGARVSVFEPASVRPQMAPIQVNVTGPDQEILSSLAQQVQRIVEETPGTADTDSTWRLGKPEIQAGVERRAAAHYGLTVREIAAVLRASVDGEVATRYRKYGQETDVRVRVAGVGNFGIDELKRLGVRNSAGQVIPLGQVAVLEKKAGPSEINRLNRQRLITVKANLADRPLGEVFQGIREKLDAIDLPPGFNITYVGETQDLQDSFGELLRALIISVVFVYAVLVMLYESFLVPVIRLLSFPLGMVGALLALVATGSTLNIMSFIGIIMLDGLVAKNSTLLIDYTHTIMAREGVNLREGLLRAGTTRLRPIVMTSLTMIAGMMPTALATSAGGELRSSMAVALIGGLILSTALTLLVIPVAYTLLEDFRVRIGLAPVSAVAKKNILS